MWFGSHNILIMDTHNIGLLVINPYSWNTWSRLNQIQAFPERHILIVVAKHGYISQKCDQDPIIYTHKLDHTLCIDIYDFLCLADIISFI